MKEILDVNVDKDLGMTEVSIRVPQFENFGKRLGELERKASEVFQAEYVEPESDPELEAEIEADLNETIGDMKESMESMRKSIEAMPDGPQKKMMMEMCKAFEEMDEEIEEEEASVGQSAAVNENRFNYDLQALRISLSDDIPWDKAAEARVDQFLSDWPSIRPAVLKATFEYYQRLHPELWEMFGDSPGKEITLPLPTDPESVADLFKISSIYLHPDGGIGLGGHCTWDEEHGYGVLIRKGKVVEVGHESEAFY